MYFKPDFSLIFVGWAVTFDFLRPTVSTLYLLYVSLRDSYDPTKQSWYLSKLRARLDFAHAQRRRVPFYLFRLFDPLCLFL